MSRPFRPMLELRLIYRERGQEDVPLYAAVGDVYSPPDILDGSDPEEAKKWSAVRVKITEVNEEGSELPGANALECLEHALLHIKSFLRHHLSTGRLYDLQGDPFDPDARSPVFESRVDVERAMKTIRPQKRQKAQKGR